MNRPAPRTLTSRIGQDDAGEGEQDVEGPGDGFVDWGRRTSRRRGRGGDAGGHGHADAESDFHEGEAGA